MEKVDVLIVSDRFAPQGFQREANGHAPAETDADATAATCGSETVPHSLRAEKGFEDACDSRRVERQDVAISPGRLLNREA